MNVVLSCYNSKKKGAYALSKEGRVAHSSVFEFKDKEEKTKKIYTLKTILQGLKVARSEVSHDDLLLIEVSNEHLAHWLMRREEYKGYEEELDEIYSVLSTIDCKYLFAYSACNKAKEKLKEDPLPVELTGARELFADMD